MDANQMKEQNPSGKGLTGKITGFFSKIVPPFGRQDEENSAGGTPAPVTELKACISGESFPLEKVNDQVFSMKILGDGLAIRPSSEIIVAPANGVVCNVAESKYALGLEFSNGIQLLIHVGIDTVAMKEMNGKGFKTFVKEGDTVKTGQKLLSFSRSDIRRAGYEDTVMMIVTENKQELPLNFAPYGSVERGTSTVISF